MDLCNGCGCPIKDKCKKYIPNQRAFYFHPQYIDGECLLFVPKESLKRKPINQKHYGKINPRTG